LNSVNRQRVVGTRGYRIQGMDRVVICQTTSWAKSRRWL